MPSVMPIIINTTRDERRDARCEAPPVPVAPPVQAAPRTPQAPPASYVPPAPEDPLPQQQAYPGQDQAPYQPPSAGSPPSSVPPAQPPVSGAPKRKGPGCLIAAIALIVIVAATAFSAVLDDRNGVDSHGNKVVVREALPSSATTETDYYTDEDGDWIHDPAKLERGLRHFYEETGVQPYVYILPNGSVRSYQELQSIAQEKYDELFTDQAHFVLVFCDDGNGRFNAAYWAGAMTGSVLDDEAINIFKAYLSQNYDDMSLSEEEIFSDAFADTADRIMTVTPSPLPIIAVCAAVIIVAVVVFLIVRNRRLAKQREAERMQEILDTPLESLADAELADLEKKYAQAGASDAPPVQPTKPRP